MVSPLPFIEPDDVVLKNLKRLKNGCILLSHENLLDPNFKITVVLICIYNNEGAFGLICNRPSHMPVSEVFDVDPIVAHDKKRIYMGGPVQQESLHVIQITEKPAKQAYCIAPNVYLGGEWESLESILEQDPASTRLFLGYSGWAPGQLEAEIAEGAWEVYHVDLEHFLLQWKEPLFHDVEKIRAYLNEMAGK